MIPTEQLSHSRRRAGVVFALLLLLLASIAGGAPALADGPPDTSGALTAKDDSKISPLLQGLTEQPREGAEPRSAQQGEGPDAGAEITREGPDGGAPPPDPSLELVRFDEDGNVEVYLYMNSTDKAALAELRELGAQIEIVAGEWGIVQAWIPPAALDRFAALDVVRDITPPDYGVTRTGSVNTEGDAIHRANLVRELSSLTGAGVKVGVIANGVNSLASAQATDDLPASVEVNPDQPGSGDEGTALLEIIHDLAPGASLAFSGSGSSLRFVRAIEWLEDDAFGGEGADIIVDDLGYYLQPYFEDGYVALAAADAVASGVVFVSAAGNYARYHYEGGFVDGGNGYHAFGANDTALAVDKAFGLTVILQWNDPFDASGTDYDLFVCARGLQPTKFNIQNGLCDVSARIQNGDDAPYEVVAVSLFDPLYLVRSVDIYIHEYTAGPAKRLELFTLRGTITEHGTPGGGIVGHPAVTGVIAVGAISASDPGHDDLEPFSDYGSAEIFFPARETRPKPEVVAIDGVAITGAGGFSNPFLGTSAAAPHVAGIAALLLEAERLARPGSTTKAAADAVYDKLVDSAVDLGDPGVDERFGAGRADALAAVAATGQLDGVTFTVDSTGDGADSDTTDGNCDNGSGACTLRAAIEEANADLGGIIDFDISGNGPHTIQPTTALPTIAKPVFIDGFSQPGASAGTIRIELDGTNAGTSTDGLKIAAASSHIRGLAINRFGGNGVVLETAGEQLLEHNLIGTNTAGTTDQGNGGAGVSIAGVSGVTVRTNVISGNDSHGISLSGATDASITGNFIGTVQGGASALANTGSGVHITGAATGTEVLDNVIAFNGGDGVTIESSSALKNGVRRNAIHSNTGLGIDLAPDGVTSNDVGDGDAGPNDLQNFPVLTAAVVGGDHFQITGSLNSTAGTLFGLDFYSNTSCDPSTNGEGLAWLGSALRATGSSGALDFTLNALEGDDTTSPQARVGNYITATASRYPGDGSGSTSEFSTCIEAGALPLLDLQADAVSVTEGATATYTVALTAPPASGVTVSLASDDDAVVTVLPASMTFTSTTWNMAQTATVTGTDDLDPVDEVAEIIHGVSIDGTSYPARPAAVHVRDDDVLTLTLTHADFGVGVSYDGRLSLTEGEETTYTVSLTTPPAADVTINASFNQSVLTVAPDSLTFTTHNWATAQDVTVRALGDFDAFPERTSIAHRTVINDRSYVLGRVAVIVADLGQPTLTLRPESVSVDEGQTATYTVELETQPTDTATVSPLSGDSGAVRVYPERLTFTSTDWNTPQTVTLTGLLDDDTRDETVSVLHLVSIVDDSLLFLSGVTVSVTDQDLPALKLSPDAIDTDEGDSPTYTVELEEEPAADLTVTVTSTDTGALTVSPAMLPFTTGDWNMPQTVTLTTITDGDARDEAVDVRHGATIGGESSILATLTARVDDSSSAPSFTESSPRRFVDEHSPLGTNVGGSVRATDDDSGDTLTYTLSGVDASFFAIVATSGQLRTNAALNHETRSSYSVTVTATDTAQNSDDVRVIINVDNLDEPGSISFTQSGAETIATLSDPDGGVSGETWQWARSSNGSTGWMDIGGATSASYTPTSDDEGMYLRATVSYSDELGSGKIVRGVSTTEVPPPGIRVTTLVSGLSIPWDIAFTPGGTMLFTQRAGVLSSRLTDGTVQTISADFSDLFVGSEVGLMAIVVDPRFSTNRRFYTCQSHSGPEVQVVAWTIDTAYTAATRVADPLVGGLPTASTHGGCRMRFGPRGYLWIATGDGRTGTVPQDLDSLGGKILRVNAMTGAGAPGNPFPAAPLVYTYGHRNVQGLALRPGSSQMWSVEHGPAFDDEINLLTAGGNYGWDPVPGYNQSVPMTDLVKFPGAVEARWSSGSSTLGTSGGIFLEGAHWGVWEGRLAVATLRDQKLRLFEFTPDGALVSQVVVSELDGTYGRLRTPLLGPDGALYVTTSNGGGRDRILRVGENRAPAFTGASASRSVAENTVGGANIGALVAATDADNDTLTYSLGGADAALFDIVPASGQLLTRELLDYELPANADRNNIYRVTVRAFDGSTTSELPVTITVTNVNEPPAFPPGESGERAVAENTPGGVNIGAPVAATDPERGDTLTYALSGAGAGSFEIVSTTGQLRTNGALDYETRTSYSFFVSVSDGKDADGNPDPATDASIAVTIRVSPVNEAPAIEGQPTSTVPERGSTFVDSYRASDPENDRIGWSLGGADSGDFTIDGGTLSFRATPDYESPADANRDNVYHAIVRASDGTNEDTLPVTVTVSNVDEAATILLSSVQPQVGTPLTATLTDPDGVSGAIAWSWERSLSRTSGWTAIDGGTSRTYTPDASDLTYYLRVAASYGDREGPGKSARRVTDDVQAAPVSNSAPAYLSTETRAHSLPENTPPDRAIGARVEATDPDNNTLTYSLGGADAAFFEIDDRTGQLRTRAPLDHESRNRYTVTVTATDPSLASATITVTVTVTNVNEAPEFPSTESGFRAVSRTAGPGTNVGAPVAATDPDAGDTLSYTLSGSGAASFGIDADTGQIVVGAAAVLDPGIQPSYSVRVTVGDSSGESDDIDVTITVVEEVTRPRIITGGGGGGGGGGPSGPTPSDIEFEWNVTRDIEELDSDHGFATGAWSNGATLWIAENGQSADDAVYAYDLESGERVEAREFELDETNRAPRGLWSDDETLWVSDSGQDKLFAHDLESGERLPDSDIELPRDNRDPRGIWSDGTTMWVLDSNGGVLFGYDLASGERVAEYALDSSNDDPRGSWSDGVTVWVSDHLAKRLFAYRLPSLAEGVEDEREEEAELERVRDEEFKLLSRAGNNSPRGLWSDGDVMYVADASDGRVYSYNMPDAIDARLASLTLSGVEFGEFDPGRPEYEGAVGEGVVETVVTAEAMQRRTTIAIDPEDADGEVEGYQIALQDLSEITVTVTSADGSRRKTYRVQFPETEWDPARDLWPYCLRGAVSEGFSLVVSAGGSVEELVGCAESRGIVALYAPHQGVYVSYILGAPDFVNAGFIELFPDGPAPITPLIAGSNGPPSADPFGDDLEDGGQQPWPECLRGDIAAGFSLVVYEGGSVEELVVCAGSRDVTALYALNGGEFVSYLLGAPAFVNQPFRDLFAEGLPLMTPLVARSEGPLDGR